MQSVSVSRWRPAGVVAFLMLVASTAYAWQPLEIESARALPKGAKKFESAIEWQTVSDGKEKASPLIFDYGLTDHLELSLEPVIYSIITPNSGTSASGIDDLEVPLKWVMLTEVVRRPALALGAAFTFAVTYDNNNSLSIRPGISVRW